MIIMNWELLRKKIYYIDGSLRDVYIKDTSMEDWEKWIDLVNTKYEVKFYNVLSGEIESQTDHAIESKNIEYQKNDRQ
ncbi:hypothetical protein CA265_23485 [Sphingobacteriaceae bacterium GW460-11-11-14-LB5]|nr:hypothetical protein CA265_23485 [Sphingobacteriaceae bacterium GW460-11-11-14-LB5]